MTEQATLPDEPIWIKGETDEARIERWKAEARREMLRFTPDMCDLIANVVEILEYGCDGLQSHAGIRQLQSYGCFWMLLVVGTDRREIADEFRTEPPSVDTLIRRVFRDARPCDVTMLEIVERSGVFATDVRRFIAVMRHNSIIGEDKRDGMTVYFPLGRI